MIGISGDTRIAVADGRNSVEIEKLVGCVIPVYCFNGNTIDVRWADSIRKSSKEEIYEVVLDDGSSAFMTKYQEIMLRDRNYCKFSDLQLNDSIMPLVKRVGRGHVEIKLNDGYSVQEHRIFLECKLGRPLLPFPGEVVHHINGNPLDNRWENLEAMSNAEHASLHNSGENNPMYGRMSGENNPMYGRMSGENNPMYGRTGKDHPMHGHKHSSEHRAKIRNAFKFMSPTEKKKMSDGTLKGKILFQARWMCDNDYPITPVSWNACREEFKEDTGRKDGFWYKIAMKYFNTQEELIKALDDNHKVKEIYHIGAEDVYTISVNFCKNFAIMTSELSGIILRSK